MRNLFLRPILPEVLEEYLSKGKISVALSIPMLALMALIHLHSVNGISLTIWLFAALLIQSCRLLVLIRLRGVLRTATTREKMKFFYAEAMLVGLAGLMWGSSLIFLDTAQLDFYFLFKYVVLAAILSTAMSSIGIIFGMYVLFVAAVVSAIYFSLYFKCIFLSDSETHGMALSITAYAFYLISIAAYFSSLGRKYFKQRWKLQQWVTKLRASRNSERRLRQLIESESTTIRQANEVLQRLATTDALTGLLNRRSLFEELGKLLHAAKGKAVPLSVIVMDIDHFKHINDQHGHPVGDAALIRIAQTITAQLRSGDVFGRWGGEEFLFVLPQTVLAEALGCAERMRRDIEQQEIETDGQRLTLTASFGVACLAANDDAAALVARADRALYQAKYLGRNRVCGQETLPP